MQSRKPMPMSFWAKFHELQLRMLASNASLSDGHPNQSNPASWPFLQRGLAFWEKSREARIYLLGSLPAWFGGIVALMSFVMRLARDHFELHRGLEKVTPERDAALRHHARTAGFLALCWALHYLPFFTMGRVLYLHHYLPAYIFSAMAAGTMLEYLAQLRHKRFAALAVSGVMLSGLAWWFSQYYPITYGLARTIDQMRHLKLLSSWDWPQ